jgi:hypothetical protein
VLVDVARVGRTFARGRDQHRTLDRVADFLWCLTDVSRPRRLSGPMA